MSRFDNGLDVVSAFVGSTVACASLVLPFTLTFADEGSPYRVTGVLSSVPRGVVLGLVIAVVTAALLYPVTKVVTAWLTAAAAAAALTVNHLISAESTSADLLTTQNYLDSLLGGILLGALGVNALRRRWTALGFSAGAITFFVFSSINDLAGELSRGERPELWAPGLVAAVTAILLSAAAVRHRHGMAAPSRPRLDAELPMIPMISVAVLAVGELAVTEWLIQRYEGGTVGPPALLTAITASVLVATVAALLLPGRDGLGLLLATALTSVATAFVLPTGPSWRLIPVIAVIFLAGMLGTKYPSIPRACLAIVCLAVLAVAAGSGFEWGLPGGIALAAVAGYVGGTLRFNYVSYPPSTILGIGALFLPSVAWTIPTEQHHWYAGEVDPGDRTAPWAALVVALAITAVVWGLMHLRRPQPSAAPVPG